MPTQTFTNANDSYLVNSPGSYTLYFLDGADSLRVGLGAAGSFTASYMGPGADWVYASAGDGRILGEAGDDHIYLHSNGYVGRGGDGNDWLFLRGDGLTVTGDQGSDHITFVGDALNVTANGGSENDVFTGNHVISGTLNGGDGNDRFEGFANTAGNVVNLYGGAGNDVYRLSGANPANAIEGSAPGIDTVMVARGISYTLPAYIERLLVRGLAGSTTGPATLNGNDQSNLIIGHNNDETINGAGGDDRINAWGGNDTLSGGLGNDRLGGDAGNDILNGGAGNDRLNGGTGDDRMAGGDGTDRYYVDSLGDAVIENAGQGNDIVRVTVSGYTLPSNVERGAIDSNAGLLLNGNSLNNLLIGRAGGDSLFGFDGNDNLRGGDGNDSLYGGNGNDLLYGGNGNDSIQGGVGADRLFGGPGDDYLCGGPGDDRIDGGTGNDTICSEGNATISGGAGNDTFLFDTAITGTVNLVDFDPLQDTLSLDVNVFTDLLGLANPDGTLLAGSFVNGTVALDTNDRIIYDATTGNLFYDPDGIGLESQILFAHIAAGTPLTNADILIGG